MTQLNKIREKTRLFDVQTHLETEEDCLLFLQSAFEEAADDPSFICIALGEVARAKGMSAVAKAGGMTREGLYKSLSADGNPSFATIQKVMSALGMRMTPQWVGSRAA